MFQIKNETFDLFKPSSKFSKQMPRLPRKPTSKTTSPFDPRLPMLATCRKCHACHADEKRRKSCICHVKDALDSKCPESFMPAIKRVHIAPKADMTRSVSCQTSFENRSSGNLCAVPSIKPRLNPYCKNPKCEHTVWEKIVSQKSELLCCFM